jgi:hypothetical protein
MIVMINCDKYKNNEDDRVFFDDVGDDDGMINEFVVHDDDDDDLTIDFEDIILLIKHLLKNSFLL